MTYLHPGDEATVICPPALAYGKKGNGAVPPNTSLQFTMMVETCEETENSFTQDSQKVADDGSIDYTKDYYPADSVPVQNQGWF